MAERPSDEWFRSAGWTEYAQFWVRDYFRDTVWYVKRSRLMYSCFTDHLAWSDDAIANNDPVALHAAWEAEQKRRNTPLDPDGWQHFDGCSVHVEGGYRVTQTQTGTRWNVWKAPHDNIACVSSKDIAIATCNQHARENGVKS